MRSVFFGLGGVDLLTYINDPTPVCSGLSHCYNFYPYLVWKKDGIIGIDQTFGDASDRWAVLHEMGHHVMNYKMSKGIPPPNPPGSYCPGSHFPHRESNEQCAWLEGWAEFVPHVVDNSSSLQDRSLYWNMEEGYYVSGGMNCLT